MRSTACFAVLALALAGCAAGDTDTRDAGRDAQAVQPDSGPRDDAGGGDAGVVDDAAVEEDAAIPGDDAGRDGGTTPTDAGLDATVPPADGGAGCPGIHAGDTISLDGTGDLATYPAEQVIMPFAQYVPSADTFGITWDAEHLYVTLITDGFMGTDGEANPLHVYVEASTGALGTVTPGTGKEYDGLTPVFEFTPTHVIAVRRTSDIGGSGPYNGVYTPTASWTTRSTPLVAGTDYWSRPDGGGISVRVPWSALGCPARIRLSAHVVNGPVAGAEWKDVLPAGATPWGASTSPPTSTPGGSYYEIDLSADPAISGWTEVGL